MNPKDRNALTEHWHQHTNYLNTQVDEAFREAQDHAYALGVARVKEDAKTRHEPRQPLTDERIDQIAGDMPGGITGFMKEWGWRQFARKVEADHGIVEL